MAVYADAEPGRHPKLVGLGLATGDACWYLPIDRTIPRAIADLLESSHVRAVALTLVGWIAMVVIAGTSETAFSFWIAANIAGLCMGSSQAAARAIVGYLAPPQRLAEFFGLWGLAVKAASIFGPLTYGAVTWIFAGNHRLGIFAVGVYFVIGLLLLAGIDVERGRRAAISA